MIDARDAIGVPCITTAPTLVTTPLSVDLVDWQRDILRGWGFEVADRIP